MRSARTLAAFAASAAFALLAGCPQEPVSPEGASPDAARPQEWPPKCAGGLTWVYTSPGCGVAAKGACGALAPCVEDFCSCDHATVSGCGGANEPWAAPGKCP